MDAQVLSKNQGLSIDAAQEVAQKLKLTEKKITGHENIQIELVLTDGKEVLYNETIKANLKSDFPKVDESEKKNVLKINFTQNKR